MPPMKISEKNTNIINIIIMKYKCEHHNDDVAMHCGVDVYHGFCRVSIPSPNNIIILQ